MTVSIGLDISLTGTGLVVLDKPKGSKDVECLLAGQVPVSKASEMGRWDRIQAVSDYIADVLDAHDPAVVIIEGYGQASHRGVQSFIKLVEVGTLVRSHLHRNARLWTEVPPPSLKLFVTGRGVYPNRAAGKKAMISGVMEEFGFQTKNDNIADAVGLAMWGLARASVIPVKPWQSDAVDRVGVPKPAKKPKRKQPVAGA